MAADKEILSTIKSLVSVCEDTSPEPLDLSGLRLVITRGHADANGSDYVEVGGDVQHDSWAQVSS